MAKRKVMGIKIKYSYNPKTNELEARFHIAREAKSRTFISNSTIRRAIHEFREKGLSDSGGRLGKILLRFDSKLNSGIFQVYDPFDVGFFGLLYSEGKKPLFGKGIAQLLESKLVKEMKRRFPSIKSFREPPQEPARIVQLEGRGITSKNPFVWIYSYETAKKRLRNKIRSDRRKARSRKRKALNKRKMQKRIL